MKPTAFYVSSYFWDRATDAGIIGEKDAITWTLKPNDFSAAGERACASNVASLALSFPDVRTLVAFVRPVPAPGLATSYCYVCCLFFDCCPSRCGLVGLAGEVASLGSKGRGPAHPMSMAWPCPSPMCATPCSLPAYSCLLPLPGCALVSVLWGLAVLAAAGGGLAPG
jgi:hypothetical protein